MLKLIALTGLTTSMLLTACASAPTPSISDKITLSEAKKLACPASVLNAGASPEDCACVESKLFELGQEPGAIRYDNAAPHRGFGGEDGKREIAIGILRLDAFEYCGFFDPQHIVSRNLQSEDLTVR